MEKTIYMLIMIFITGFISALAQDDAELIRQFTNTWEKETNAENLEGVLATMTEDAIIFMPGTAPIKGKESIRSTYRDYYKMYDLNYTATIKEIEIFDKKAYVWALVEGSRESKRDGEIEQLAFNNVWILKKESTKWKFWRAMFNRTPHKD